MIPVRVANITPHSILIKSLYQVKALGLVINDRTQAGMDL